MPLLYPPSPVPLPPTQPALPHPCPPAAGQAVALARERGNPHDPHAVAIRGLDGAGLGYIPRDRTFHFLQAGLGLGLVCAGRARLWLVHAGRAWATCRRTGPFTSCRQGLGLVGGGVGLVPSGGAWAASCRQGRSRFHAGGALAASCRQAGVGGVGKYGLLSVEPLGLAYCGLAGGVEAARGGNRHGSTGAAAEAQHAGALLGRRWQHLCRASAAILQQQPPWLQHPPCRMCALAAWAAWGGRRARTPSGASP